MIINNTPLVSVLIPAYNSGAYIGETLDSVIAQSYKIIEIVVVDDGSSDNTVNVLETYSDRGVKFVSQLNSGAAAARNMAFSISHGDYVIYLDADDLICPDHIAHLLSALQGQENDVIAFSQWDRFYTDFRDATFPSRPTNMSKSGVEWLITDWAEVNMQQCGMFLIPREHVERLGGWLPGLSRGPCDDFEFFARLISGSQRMIFAPGAKLFYRSGLFGSLSRRSSRLAIEVKFESIQLGTSHLIAKANSACTRQACANKLQTFIYETYPDHLDLLEQAARLVSDLATPTVQPSGPPGFMFLKRLIGWRLAKRVQRWVTLVGLNRASLRDFCLKHRTF